MHWKIRRLKYKLIKWWKERHQRRIFKKYPDIFVEACLPPGQSCMHWGLDVGEGWIENIDLVCATMQELSKRTGIKIIAKQVKEKFGGLRFYHSLEFPEGMDEDQRKFLGEKFRQLSDIMEILCSFTCEDCGKDGNTKGSTGWITCLCSECRDKEKSTRSSW